MKFTDENGKQWEFGGNYRCTRQGDYFLSTVGKVQHVTGLTGREEYCQKPHAERAIVHPVPIVHEFGGIKFEETGEYRRAQPGEWYLLDDRDDKAVCNSL